MSIVISLAKNEEFVKVKYEVLKDELFDYLQVLLNKCYNYNYSSINDALYHVGYLVQDRKHSNLVNDAILVILTQLDLELNDAHYCFDCVYNKVMYENGFARVCSKPHYLIWCRHYRYVLRKQFPYWAPSKVISVDGDSFFCRSFIDGCSTLRKRVSTKQVTETLSPKTQTNLAKAYPSVVNAIHMLNLHLEQLRKEYGNSKILYYKNQAQWNRVRVELNDNRNMILNFPDFEPDVLCNK